MEQIDARSSVLASTRMVVFASVLVGVLTCFTNIAHADTAIPPRPSGPLVADTVQLLSGSAVDTIDRLNTRLLTERNGAEIGVLIVTTTDGENPRAFATRAFNIWKLGSASADNGAIIMVAKDDRKVELVLGDGVDDASQIASAQTIVSDYITPKFKAGDFEGGVLDGAQQTAEQILGLSPEAPLVSVTSDVPADTLPDSTTEPNTAVEYTPQPLVNRDPPRVDPTPPSSSNGGVDGRVVGGLGAGGAAAMAAGAREVMRRRPRKCSTCSTAMTRLDEAADDAKLEEGQRTEEGLGSVDYDVWVCGQDGTTEVVRYGRLFTRYKQCPSCGLKAKTSSSNTIVSATTSHGGQVEVNESCANCNYSNTYTRTTSRLSSSSSSGSSSSFSSSSRSGGGSSSGGGASGSW
jgi:uncharacterized protein